MTSTVFIAIIILIVGFAIRHELDNIKRMLYTKDYHDICDTLNSKNTIVRDLDSKSIPFHAHVAYGKDTDKDIIVIDI
jgi:hypothetical protein